MVRRSLSIGVLGSLVLLTGCSALGDDGSSDQAAISSSENAPITQSFQADGKLDSYLASMTTEVKPYSLPFVEAGAKTFKPGQYGNVTFGKFKGAAGKNIAYGIYKAEAERAALVLVPGRTESFGKYGELIYDMRQSGVSVYAMDIRGQGWSDRLLDDDREKGYIDSFDYYVDDVKTFRDTIVMASPHPKTILFGHSTGGGINTLYLEQHPGDFDAAILNSPMHEIKTDPLWEWVASGVTGALMLIEKGDDYAPGSGPYKLGAFAANGCEHSPERWKNATQFSAEFPETRIGGATNGWVHRSIAATHTMKDNASKIRTPFLLLQARQDDVVVPAAQDVICDAANANGAAICTKVSFGDASLTKEQCQAALDRNDLVTADRCAGHELLFERDRVRGEVEKAISSYVDKVTGVRR